MKKFFYACLMLACTVTVASCSKANSDINDTVEEGKNTVNISFKTGKDLFSGTRAGGEISPADFSLLAFRMADDSNEYYFYENVPTSGFTYDPDRKEFTGNVSLSYGTYKFIPSIGLANSGNVINWPIFSGGVTLTDNIYYQYAFGNVPEIFMDITPVSSLRSLSVDYNNSATNSYSATLKRAVGRVDIQFIAADLVEGVIVPDTRDVTGGFQTGSLILELDGLSPQMSLVGQVPMQANDSNLVDNRFIFTDLMNITLRGNHPTENVVGTDDFSHRYDYIQPEDMIQGSIYFPGPYYLPQYEPENVSDDTPYRKSHAVVTIENTASVQSRRVIEIPSLIPIRQNMVTVIKIYVLSEHIYSTSPTFVVDVDVVWNTGTSIEAVI